MELWDIYDSNKQRTGRTMRRNDWCLQDGEYHLTGNRKQPILHYHKYDENLDRTSADYLPKEMYEKYKKYLEAYGL